MIKPRWKRKRNPVPERREISELEQSYYQHQAFMALHSAGIHSHHREEHGGEE